MVSPSLARMTSTLTRYILVAFCTIDPAYSRWAYALSEHVQAVVDPGEVDEGSSTFTNP